MRSRHLHGRKWPAPCFGFRRDYLPAVSVAQFDSRLSGVRVQTITVPIDDARLFPNGRLKGRAAPVV